MEEKTQTEIFNEESDALNRKSAATVKEYEEQQRILFENDAKLEKEERDRLEKEARAKANTLVTNNMADFVNKIRGKNSAVPKEKVEALNKSIAAVGEVTNTDPTDTKNNAQVAQDLNKSENTAPVSVPLQAVVNPSIPTRGTGADGNPATTTPAKILVDATTNTLPPGPKKVRFSKDVADIYSDGSVVIQSISSRGPNAQITPEEIGRCKRIVNAAYSAAKCIIETPASGVYKFFKFLTKKQTLIAIVTILIMGGVGYIGYSEYQKNEALGNALDKLNKATQGLINSNEKGCFLITNSDYIRLDDDCSTWYSTGDNRFSCRCGTTLTDTKQPPDCSNLSGGGDCSAPYCLGQSCTTSGSLSPSPQPKCSSKQNNSFLTLPQCTTKDRDDPDYISYAYSDSLPLEPYITTYSVNKQIYDQYYNSSQDKTLMYVSIGISALALLVLIFFITKYYMKKKNK